MALKPADLRQNNQQALQCFQQGKLKEAQKRYQKTLKIDPNNAESLHLLGLIALQQKDYYQAEKSIRKSIRSMPQYWQAHNNLGVVLQEAGKLGEAKKVLSALVTSQPSYVDAQKNLGIVLGQLGETEQAIQLLEKIRNSGPSAILVQYALAQVYRQGHQLEQAVECYQAVLKLQPNHRDTLYFYAQCLDEFGNHNVAFEQVSLLLNLYPKDLEALILRGTLHQNDGRLTEAKKDFETVLSMDKTNIAAQHNLASIYLNQRLYQQAMQTYQAILSSKGKHASTLSASLMLYNYTNNFSLEQSYEAHKRFEKQLEPTTVQPTSRKILHGKVGQGRRIKIGFVSADFFYHSVAYFFLPLIQHLDKARFEVFCYYNNIREDQYTQDIRSHADHWYQCSGDTAVGLYKQIDSDQIDVLIDLSGHSRGHCLEVFAKRAAPLQISWLGYPNTSGLKEMDVRFVDAYTDPLPESQCFYTETLNHLPSFLCYQAPDNAPDVGESAFEKNGYITFGSFNNLVKVTDEVLAVWARILQQVTDSRLILKSSQLEDQETRDGVLRVFEQAGIQSERIQLLARIENPEDHLTLYNEIDIGLDPFPYNGTTTSFEALWMGVPVITSIGDRHAARVGYSIMSHLELNDCIADRYVNHDVYVETARALASNKDRLKTLKEGLRERLANSILCDAQKFTQNFESAVENLINSKPD